MVFVRTLQESERQQLKRLADARSVASVNASGGSYCRAAATVCHRSRRSLSATKLRCGNGITRFEAEGVDGLR